MTCGQRGPRSRIANYRKACVRHLLPSILRPCPASPSLPLRPPPQGWVLPSMTEASSQPHRMVTALLGSPFPEPTDLKQLLGRKNAHTSNRCAHVEVVTAGLALLARHSHLRNVYPSMNPWLSTRCWGGVSRGEGFPGPGLFLTYKGKSQHFRLEGCGKESELGRIRTISSVTELWTWFTFFPYDGSSELYSAFNLRTKKQEESLTSRKWSWISLVGGVDCYMLYNHSS